MSDPGYPNPNSEPRFPDPHRALDTDPAALRRLNHAADRAGTMWGWVAAIVAAVVIIALLISYDRSDKQASDTSVNVPSTTGAAPRMTAPGNDTAQSPPRGAPSNAAPPLRQ